jgi:hypothetical protein
VLPLDPAKHDRYREKIREARARQGATIPKGSKFSDAHRAALKEAFNASPLQHSKNQRGSLNPNYKGGRVDKHGYHVVVKDGKQCFQHRLIMENMIGRALLPQETVHHKNGIRNDNRQQNLELWASGNPRGQRVEDKVEFALEILALYGKLVGAFSDEKSLDSEDEYHL